MFNLTKEEKLALVFLVSLFIIGSGVSFYRKHFDRAEKGMGLLSKSSYKKDKESRTFIVNINTADFNQLIKLKGIGKKMAVRIIEYRMKNGSFFYKEDLMKIKGIGKVKFDAIKDDIIVE